ncbi:hypothetical protein BR93DRAFT_370887 [Coniochaeta sp. PMI_546]|nr:hypothetical protein BR93DRAFT_370887 [Coniochaeta sp. PMI_546]
MVVQDRKVVDRRLYRRLTENHEEPPSLTQVIRAKQWSIARDAPSHSHLVQRLPQLSTKGTTRLGSGFAIGASNFIFLRYSLLSIHNLGATLSEPVRPFHSHLPQARKQTLLATRLGKRTRDRASNLIYHPELSGRRPHLLTPDSSYQRSPPHIRSPHGARELLPLLRIRESVYQEHIAGFPSFCETKDQAIFTPEFLLPLLSSLHLCRLGQQRPQA